MKEFTECLQEVESSLQEVKKESFVYSGEWVKDLKLLLEKVNFLNFDGVADKDIYLFLRGKITDYLDRVYSCYGSSGFSDFKSNLEKILSNFDGAFGIFFQNPGIFVKNKRIPGFLEACRATIARLEVINDFCRDLPNVTGVIIGGSVSYGRFYNVREKHPDQKGSDIDTLVIVDDQRELFELRKSETLDERDKQIFTSRLDNFCSSGLNDNFKVFSQRFNCEKGDFTLSFHSFPISLIDSIITEMNKDLKNGNNKSFFVTDYRSDPYKKGVLRRYNFCHNEFSFYLDMEKDEQNYILKFPVYSVLNDEFLSSVYFNVLLPESWILADKDNFTYSRMKRVRELMELRLESERHINQDKTLLKSHVRYPVFRDSILTQFDF